MSDSFAANATDVGRRPQTDPLTERDGVLMRSLVSDSSLK